jgi:hypothetical protein
LPNKPFENFLHAVFSADFQCAAMKRWKLRLIENYQGGFDHASLPMGGQKPKE